jgi:methyl-accepting chemotaxis protein
MRLFRKLSLVVKLALVAGMSMALMATVMIFAILDLSHEKARHAAELQASTALRVFEDSLAGNSDTIRYGQPIGDRHTATIWDGTPFEYSQDAMDRISDVTGARLTFFSYDAGTGAFRRSLTNVRQADGRPAVGTSLGSESPARPALTSGSQYSGYSEVVGLTHLTIYEPVLSESGTVTGAIAAAVPQGSLAAAAREIIFSLSSWLILSLAVGLTVTVASLWWLLRPLAQTTRVVSAMARKDFTMELPRLRSEDEVGRVARAVAELRNDLAEGARMAAAAEEQEAERERQRLEQVRVVDDLKAGLSRLAEGDLTRRIESPPENPFPAGYETLRESYNAVIDRVGGVLARINAIADGVRTSSQTITKASRDLSGRTETQAATLEESAAALNQLTVSVRSTAERAAGAEEASQQNRNGAQSGAHVVGQAVEAMQGIEKSSEQITRIIGVIDDIAFQTNLLALNAGVEAARAGEAGRGFAVVASEVRLLAQRASDSAREIKELISKSAEQVETGSSLVNQAGEALADILEQAQRAASFVEEIASAAAEQANGLKEINTGVNQLDHATQQNRAVSEETTASAADLLAQSDELIAALSEFRIEGGERSTAKRGGGASGADTGSESSIVAVKPRVADWQAAADAAARAPRAQPSEPAGAAASSAARVAPAGSAAPAAVAKGGSWHEF